MLAQPQAGRVFDGQRADELALLPAQFQLPGKALHEALRPSHGTSGVVANVDHGFGDGLAEKERVEVDDAIDIGQGHAQFCADLNGGAFGDVTVQVLGGVKGG